MQAIGIVSVLASALVALVATVVAARTQMRLHRLGQVDAKLSELRDVLDGAAQELVRSKYLLAEGADLEDQYLWDRDFFLVEARIRVRLGSESSIYLKFAGVWSALDAIRKGDQQGRHLSDEERIMLWEEVDEAMESFFEETAAVLGPERKALEAVEQRSVRERLRERRDIWVMRRRLRRYGHRLDR